MTKPLGIRPADRGHRWNSPRENFDLSWRWDRGTGCWVWIRNLCRQGYGRFRLDGRYTTAQRASYALYVGDLIDGMHIDHLCRNRACVNPFHLEQVTPKENAVRAAAVKTHCPHGHRYGDADADGKRRCSVCRAAARADYYRRTKK